MMFKSRRILHVFIPVISLVLAACNNTPFAGIAVPGMTSVIPKAEGDTFSIQEELKALHVINPLPYEIKPGDSFHLSVYNQASLDANLLIAPDGTTSLPLVGIVTLSGLNMEDATNLIEEKLSKYLRSPLVTLSPVSISGYYFTVFGRVNKPGNYTVSVGQTRLLDALALSGGFQTGQFNGDTVELADLDNAFIKRNGKKLPVDFKKLVNDGDDLHNIPLLNGDYIYVPSTMNGFIIFLGEVGSNSYVGFKDGMTLLQGLSYVKGLKTETYTTSLCGLLSQKSLSIAHCQLTTSYRFAIGNGVVPIRSANSRSLRMQAVPRTSVGGGSDLMFFSSRTTATDSCASR